MTVTRIKYHPLGLLPRWFTVVDVVLEEHSGRPWARCSLPDGRLVWLYAPAIVERIRV